MLYKTPHGPCLSVAICIRKMGFLWQLQASHLGAFAACLAVVCAFESGLQVMTHPAFCTLSLLRTGVGRDWAQAQGGPGGNERKNGQHAAPRVEAAQAPQLSPGLVLGAVWVPVSQVPREGGSCHGGGPGEVHRLHLHAPATTAGDGVSGRYCAGQQMCRPVSKCRSSNSRLHNHGTRTHHLMRFERKRTHTACTWLQLYTNTATQRTFACNCSQNSHICTTCTHTSCHDLPAQSPPAIARRFLTSRLLAMQDGQGAAEAAAQSGAWQA